ncbi:diguanylate cyclase domain-containing protein [Vibrio harveyi]|uniref:diguanylate cyclase domain-containing protein n=1 Tax=Vibrio harveyi TaxID=669 RepID=UPI001A7EF739|nr:diguanylate cyclase [Vibrio harveyi]
MLSRQDPLTQLYNRYELEKVVPEVIANAVEKNEPLTCLMIDVDYYLSLIHI